MVKVLAASSYVNDTPVPAVSSAFTLSSTLSFVKYTLEEPSPISSVSKVRDPPNESEFEFTVTELFASFEFAIEPPNIAFVTPDAFTLNVSESISMELSST